MARIRSNNVFGTVESGVSSPTWGSFSSAGLVNLATFGAPDIAVITLDPNRVHGAPEIVHAIAHGGGSDAVNILRGQEGTAGRTHPIGTFWVHAPTRFDYVLEWAAYTPVNSNITVGNGTQVARVVKIGRTVHWSYILTFGSTTLFTGAIGIGLPEDPVGPVSLPVGSAHLQDASGSDQPGVAYVLSTGAGGSVRVLTSTTGGVVTATAPFVWTTGDVLAISGTYETAV